MLNIIPIDIISVKTSILPSSWPFAFNVSLPVTARLIAPGTGRARVFTATVAWLFALLRIITRGFQCLVIVPTTVDTSLVGLADLGSGRNALSTVDVMQKEGTENFQVATKEL